MLNPFITFLNNYSKTFIFNKLGLVTDFELFANLKIVSENLREKTLFQFYFILK